VSPKVSPTRLKGFVLKLTDRALKTAKAEQKDLFLSDGLGLYLRVRPSGSKTWLYRYKVEKTTRWHELGIYPDMPLADARLAAHNAKALRKSGDDPVEKKISIKKEKELARVKAAARLTVNQLFDKWRETDLKHRKDKGAEVLRLFKKDVLPHLGEIKADELTKAQIMQVIDNLLERNVDRTAKLVLSLLRQMLRFALERGIINTEPSAAIRKSKIGKAEVPRDRVLSETEIQALAKAMPNANLNKTTEIAIWLTLATGCRIGELLKAQWIHVDFDNCTWLIPEANSKNGEAHKIYLSTFALSYFKELRKLCSSKEWCFPNRDSDNHVCLKTITKQVSDRQLSGDMKPMTNRTKQSIGLLLPNGKWTPHDLRRTAATIMTALGILPDIADKCLNHKEPNRMRRTYILHSYDKEKQVAWETLGGRLQMLTVNINSNVIFGNFKESA
jgi:integrase